VRIRIALATATAVTFMTTSFHIQPAAAQTVTQKQSVHSTTVASTGAFVFDVYPEFAVGGAALVNGSRTLAGHVLWGKSVTTALRRAAAAAAAAPPPAVLSPPPAPPPPPTDATSTDTPDWQCIRTQESGDEYNNPTRPSGAYGILQITWNSNGFSGWPYQAAPALQDALALKLYNEYGWLPWSSRFSCGLG